MPKYKKIFFSTLTSLTLLSLMVSPVLAKQIVLKDGNWHSETKKRLENLLNTNANKGKKVIFDIDNTTISRDIGDATFAYIVKEKLINPENIKAISPDFTLEGKPVSLESGVDLTVYYENLLNSTLHHQADINENYVGYTWVVQALSGMTPFDVMEASRKAFMNNQAANDRKLGIETKINVTEGKTSYRVPFFHPETVDLIGNLLSNGFDVYVVSASNIWTIRYMISVELAKLLKKQFGRDLSIKPENIFGITALMKDKRTGKLYKDPLLVRENTQQAKLYMKLDPQELKNYELTNLLVNPIPVYEGKRSTIFKYIVKENEKPFLVCGDSPGDFSMLEIAENKLWFSRLESFDYQKRLIPLVKKSKVKNWFIQPVLYKKNPGLLKDLAQLKTLVTDKDYKKYSKSVKILRDNSVLNYF